jgi:hypothetical protein
MGFARPVAYSCSARKTVTRTGGSSCTDLVRLRVLVVVALLGAVLPFAPTGARAGTGLKLEPTGDLPLGGGDTVVSDNVARRLIVVQGGYTPTSTFLLFDPVRRVKLAERVLPHFLLNNAGALGHTRQHAWDEKRGRLFFVSYPSANEGLVGANPSLLTIDRNGDVLGARPISPFPPSVKITGIGYSRAVDRLYVIGQGQADPTNLVGTYTVMVNELDPTTGSPTWPRAHAIPGCQRSIGFNSAAAIMRNRQNGKLYFGCGTGNLIVSPQPGLPAVAEMDIRDPAAPTVKLHPVAGSYAAGESIADEEGGKFILLSAGANQPVQAAWIFDQAHGVFSGVVSAGNINVLMGSVEPTSGHLFVAISGALLVGTDRFMKVPQALKQALPELTTSKAMGVVSIPWARLLLIPMFQSGTAKDYYRLFRAELPDYVESPADDPDRATIDAPEAPGQVEADFAGDAQAYGLRIHEVNGLNGAMQNAVASQTNWWTYLNAQIGTANAALGPARDQGAPPMYWPNDGSRDAYFGRVNKVHLGQGEATATAIEGDRDAVTEADYTQATGQKWPYEFATCVDFGAGESEATRNGATVTCDQDRHLAEAVANHESSGGGEETVAVGGAGGVTTLTRKRGQPLKVVARAEARDVDIAGVVHFGRIRSESVAEAGGRPGTAKASYTRAFEEVTMPGFSCSTECDEQQVVDHMNALLGIKLRAELPAAQVLATPKGARADASREPWQHQQDIVINDQAESEVQVPALRLTFLNDNAQRSRLVFEFGATDATAEFRLFSLGAGSDGLGPTFAGSAFGDPEASGGSSFDAGVVAGFGAGALGSAEAIDASRPSSGPGGLLRRLGRGLALALLGRDHTVLNALLWALLATPVFLSARRRYLLRLVGAVQ